MWKWPTFQCPVSCSNPKYIVNPEERLLVIGEDKKELKERKQIPSGERLRGV